MVNRSSTILDAQEQTSLVLAFQA